jgi:hypothetical protein
MTLSIEEIQEKRGPFGSYRHQIIQDGTPVAILSHNYRWEPETIQILATGRRVGLPFKSRSEFLAGDGHLPYGLTGEGKRFLESLLTGAESEKPATPRNNRGPFKAPKMPERNHIPKEFLLLGCYTLLFFITLPFTIGIASAFFRFGTDAGIIASTGAIVSSLLLALKGTMMISKI